MNSYKVMVIGLDGATFDLLKPWAEQGYLPTIKRLMREGTWGELGSTIPPMTAPAWTSFATGKNPGKHGLYDWIYRHEDSYSVSPLTAQHIKEPTLWSLLSKADHRVCVFNVPMTYPPQPTNGLMISGMPAPSKQVTITYPESLLNEIESEVGTYHLYPDPGQAYSDSGVDAFIEKLYLTTRGRFEVLEYLRSLEDWDFIMPVLNGTDTVQHAMWKFMDPKHPLHDPKKSAKYGDAILDYYRYVDKSLSAIVDSLDDNTVLVIMSDHGFGPFHKFIHVNNWLRKHGWLKLKRSPISLIKSWMFGLGFSPMAVYDWLMRLGFGKLKREVVRGRGQGMLKTFFLSFDDVDWSASKAYSLGNVGQIFLNVKGREPQGTVNPGKEYELLRDEIIDQLWQLKDPATGEQVVETVYRREELYSEPALQRAADIVFIPTRLEYFGFGEYEFGSHLIIEPVKRGISGTHRLNGILMLYGQPIKSSTILENATLYDLAPTILHLMGEPVLKDMDGSVLRDALLSPLDDPSSIQYVDQAHDQDFQEGEGLTDEEKSIIADRLRDLGYVG
jgi:predicted AlkP superfamily phosphohydrolase/phosphomutase